MELHKDEIEGAGLRVVAVGLGRSNHARHFGDKLAPSVDCVATEEPDLHASYGIGRLNPLRLVAPDVLAAGARASARGHVQGKATGDAFRLGATFIVDTDGIVRFAHYDKYPGDHPNLEELLRHWQRGYAAEAAGSNGTS